MEPTARQLHVLRMVFEARRPLNEYGENGLLHAASVRVCIREGWLETYGESRAVFGRLLRLTDKGLRVLFRDRLPLTEQAE